jgi:hypothetical protein
LIAVTTGGAQREYVPGMSLRLDHPTFAGSTWVAWVVGIACVACTALASCAQDGQARGLEKPEAPQMRTLDAYDAPTAAITRDSMDDLLLQASTLAAAVDAIGIEHTLLRSLSTGLVQLDKTDTGQIRQITGELAVRQDALSLPGEGYLEITRICDGWGEAPVPDPAHGELHMIAGYGDGGIDPVVWGTVTACRYLMSGREVQLEGTTSDPEDSDVRMYIGEDVEVDELGNLVEPVIVELSARATVDGREVAAALDFRIDVRTRAVELIVPVGSGHVLVAVDPSRAGSMQARATNGTFSCAVDSLSCTGADGEELSLP